MKVVAILGEGKAGLIDRPDPTPKEDFALVKVHLTPMCTEYKTFKSGNETEKLGHEAAGEVVEVTQPGPVKVGDRVVVQPQYPCGRCSLCLAGDYIHCQNGRDFEKIFGSTTGTATYAQYLLKPAWLLSNIPDGVSYEHAGMAVCGLGPTFGAMRQMRVDALDTVLITGLGPVGLGAVINARYFGARTFGVESNAYRAKLAKELGAEEVFDPNDKNVLQHILDATGGVGVDKAVDCSGASPAHRLMLDSLRRKGQASFVGQGKDFPLSVSKDMIRKGLVLRGVWHYNIGEYPEIMKVIQNSPDQLDRFITHRFPMSQVQNAFESQVTGETGKVVLDPWK